MYTIPKINPVYQPIISVSKKSIIGFEGLSRGYDELENKHISPDVMFREAGMHGSRIELDRECRQKCIEGFEGIFLLNHENYLFLNIDTSILDKVCGSDYLYQQIEGSKFTPRNIVIEINESLVKDPEVLLNFIKRYKSYGFLICLDDIGTGYSNYERIAMAEPDIIKIDRSLISDIDKSYFKQEVFKSLVSMSNRIGTLVVAEGVETKEELNTVIYCGAHLIQGYFLARPGTFDLEGIKRVNELANRQILDYIVEYKFRLQRNKAEQKRINGKLSKLVSKLMNEEPTSWDRHLEYFVKYNSASKVECAYILDENGIQVSETALSANSSDFRKSLLFKPATKGSDDSMMKYYYEPINLNVGRYISDPYISSASGNVCRTYSSIFKNHKSKKLILCVDILYTYSA